MSIKPLLVILLTMAIAPPALARDPADPGASVPAARYKPVTAGTKTFRPVEPLPWGDVNRRVTPPDAADPPPPPKGQTAPKAGPHSKH